MERGETSEGTYSDVLKDCLLSDLMPSFKYSNDDRFEWLALPHNVNISPNEAVVRHPHREHWHRIGHRFKQRFHLEEDEIVEPPYTPPPHGSCRVQAVRSVCDWSHGVLTEHSVQNAYIQMIKEANHFIFFGTF